MCLYILIVFISEYKKIIFMSCSNHNNKPYLYDTGIYQVKETNHTSYNLHTNINNIYICNCIYLTYDLKTCKNISWSTKKLPF